MSDPQGVVDLIADRVHGAHRQGSEWRGICPAHEDNRASLQWRLADRDGENGGVLVWCGAGCSAPAVMAALGMRESDLFAEPRITATYVYTDERGNPLWAVHRWSNKEFRVDPGLPPAAHRVLYNLPWVAHAVRTGQTVYVVEGEKDVETLRAHGLVGTCNVGGAGRGKWLAHYTRWFHGANVVVIADRDAPGEAHAREVHKALRSVVASLTLCRPGYGKDVSDLFAAGFDITHVEAVLEDAPLGLLHGSQVRPRRVRWAWPKYVPFGTYTLIEGDPGDGKSTLTCDLVARWSNGMAMPDDAPSGGPYQVAMISAEDDPETTMTPRLLAAGADMDSVWFVVSGHHENQPYNIGLGLLEATEALVTQRGIKVIVLDPLMAFLPDGVNGHVDAEVRRALAPLASLARRLEVAVVVVRHLTKSATRALYAGSGSIGIAGASRSTLLVRPHPQDPTLRVIAPVKTNLVRKPPSIGYRLVDNETLQVASVRWVGEVGIDADLLFAGTMPNNEESETATWLRGYLTSCSGSAPLKDIRTAANRVGLDWEGLRKAKRQIGVLSTGQPGPGGTWHWTLPAKPQPYGPKAHLSLVSPVTEATVVPFPAAPAEPQEELADPEPEQDEEPDRDTDLAGRPLVCEVCGGEDDVSRWAEPWWTVRCLLHNPVVYGGGDAG